MGSIASNKYAPIVSAVSLTIYTRCIWRIKSFGIITSEVIVVMAIVIALIIALGGGGEGAFSTQSCYPIG